MALGKLGWSERQYYTSSPEAFFFASRGYFSKLEDNSLAVRNLGTIIYKINGGKGSINKIWPLSTGGTAEKEVITIDQEWWDKIMKLHNT